MQDYTPADSLLYLAAMAGINEENIYEAITAELEAHELGTVDTYSDGTPVWTTTPRLNHPGHPGCAGLDEE